jgi:hypothetical protein
MGKKNKLITNAPAVITAANDGIVEYQLTSTDTLVSGTFLAEFVVTFSNGTQKTFPSNGYITVTVEQNLDTNQANVVLDMIAEKQGDFTSKLNSILLQAGNINMSAMNEYTWTATEGQLIYTFPVGSNYSNSTKWFQVSVGNVPVANSLVNRSYANQFALIIDPTYIQAGMEVRAMWVEPIVPVSGGHHTTHELNGQDEIDIRNLRNYQEMRVELSNLVEVPDVADYRCANIYGKRWSNAFSLTNQRALDILDIAADTKMNMVAVIPTNIMPSPTANTFNGMTQPRTDVVSYCQLAKNSGFMVCVKPYVEVQDYSWRANIAPSDIATWFANFKTWLVDMANLAQSVGAELLCLGAEMKSVTIADYRSYWVDIISSIRAVFTGKLTYGVNGDGDNTGDELYTCCFLDLLDYAGIDFYPSLTNQNDPTVDDLVNAWYKDYRGIEWVRILESWQLSHGKKVIFNEIGTTRIDGSNKAPESTFSGTISEQDQADYITAAFKVLRKRYGWVKGLHWWALDNDNPDLYSFEFEPSRTEMIKGNTSNYMGVI